MEIANEQIFEKLFRDHYSLLCNYACRYITDSQTAEDIVQTFFISIWEKKHLTVTQETFLPYAYRAIRNSCINYYKSEIIKEEDEYVQSETEKIFKEILLTDEKNKIEFDPRKFNEQEKVIQKNLILLAIKKVKGSTQGIEKVNIDDIIKLCNNNIGNKLIRPVKQLEIGIKNKRIYIKNIIKYGRK